MLDGIGRVVIPLNGFLSSNPDSQGQTSTWANNVKLCSACWWSTDKLYATEQTTS